jgi:hypothetical protein
MKRTVIKNIGTMLLISIFALTSIGAIPQSALRAMSVSELAVTAALEIQKDPNLSEEEKIKSVINAYFVTRYESMKMLDKQEFSSLIQGDDLKWITQENDRREVEIYIATLAGLRYQDYKFSLDYDLIEIKNGKAVVELRESHDVIYETMAPEVTKLANLHHTFMLQKNNHKWTISKEEYRDEFSDVYSAYSKEQIKEQFRKNFQEYKKSLTMRDKVQAVPLVVNNSYNRASAKLYSKTYRSYALKNPTYKSMYSTDGYGGDCTNFVSQILYAGAPKMSTNWKYNKKGTTSTSDDTWTNSWSVAGNLGDFLTSNTGLGPYGSVVTITSISSGDVILLSDDGGSFYFHAVAAYQYVNGSLTIVGHDIDRFNYPITNYFVYTLKLIHIKGWRS